MADVLKIERLEEPRDHRTGRNRRFSHLCDSVMKYTAGNPFFVQTVICPCIRLMLQFLKTLVDQHLIFFDFEETHWDWNAEQISKIEVSENIIEFIVHNTLQDSIYKDTVEILKFASCLANRDFNSSVLGKAFRMPPEDLFQKLWPAVKSGLIQMNDEPLKVSGISAYD